MTVFVSLRGCLDASDQSTGIAQTERQRDRDTERQRGREVLVARVNATVLTVSLFLLAVGGRRNRTRMGKYHLITGPRPPDSSEAFALFGRWRKGPGCGDGARFLPWGLATSWSCARALSVRGAARGHCAGDKGRRQG